MNTSCHRRVAGVTIVELMITLVVLSVLLSVAVPAFNNTIKENRLVSAQSRLISFFTFARSVALTRAADVAICPSEDAETCDNDWSEGWIVFIDADLDGDRGPSEELLRVQQDDTELTITEAGALGVIRFSTVGIPNATASFTIEDPDNLAPTRLVSVSATGLASNSAALTCP